MLLGSNLPIFGNDSHPAVSIRLCDMNKPITVLTGLDYWLDNLMCNVPQVAMCYHLDGIVKVSVCAHMFILSVLISIVIHINCVCASCI